MEKLQNFSEFVNEMYDDKLNFVQITIYNKKNPQHPPFHLLGTQLESNAQNQKTSNQFETVTLDGEDVKRLFQNKESYLRDRT